MSLLMLEPNKVHVDSRIDKARHAFGMLSMLCSFGVVLDAQVLRQNSDTDSVLGIHMYIHLDPPIDKARHA